MLNLFRKKTIEAKLDPESRAYWLHLKALTSRPYNRLVFRLWTANFIDRKTYDHYNSLRDVVMALEDLGINQVDEFTTCVHSLNVYKDFAYKLSNLLETSSIQLDTKERG